MKFRTGFGYDVHQLAEGFSLNLGGIIIPHTKGTVGHSDADVLIHAICDSLLGAAAARDIGHHFPDTDKKYKGIDSKILLAETLNIITRKGFSIGNIDCTVCLQQPKINPYIPEIALVLANVLKIAPDQINIKATTTEKMGYVGQEEGVACYATCLIESNQ